MINNIFSCLLRARTRNARTRAKADVTQVLRLVATAVAGRTMQNRCRTYLPSVWLLRANLRIPQKGFQRKPNKLLMSITNIVPNYKQKKYIFKIVKYSLQN